MHPAAAHSPDVQPCVSVQFNVVQSNSSHVAEAQSNDDVQSVVSSDVERPPVSVVLAHPSGEYPESAEQSVPQGLMAQ